MLQFSQSNSVLITIILFIAGFLLVLSGIYFHKILSRWKKRSRLRNNSKEGHDGELRAKEYLLRHGFTIIREQSCSEHQIFIDGEPKTFQLRPDFIVSKGGKISVVDAKSGSEGVDPTSIATRRQLLEYFIYYNADNAYVYNSKENSLHLVSFRADLLRPQKWINPGFLLLAFLIMELIVIVMLHYFRFKLSF
jgi:hypothetical protein